MKDLEKTTIAILIGAGSAIVLGVMSLIGFVIHSRLRYPSGAGPTDLNKSYSGEFQASSDNDELYHNNGNGGGSNNGGTVHVAKHGSKPPPFTQMKPPLEFDEDGGDPDLISSSNKCEFFMSSHS